MAHDSDALLRSLTRQVEDHGQRLGKLVDGIPGDALLWRPRPRSWSIAECLEHLIATCGVYHPWLRRALERTAPGGEASYRRSLGARAFLRMSGPRPLVRLKAPGPFVPPSAAPDAPERFREAQRELRDLLASAAGRDLSRPRGPSPLTRLLRLSPGEALEGMVGHQERHLRQAERVRETPGFPGPGALAGAWLFLGAWIPAAGGVRAASAGGSELPFWVLFVAYAILFLVAWIHRLVQTDTRPPDRPRPPGFAPGEGPRYGIWPRNPWDDPWMTDAAGALTA